MYHFLVYYTGLNDVEDLVQEVFIRAIKGIDVFQENSTPRTWLFSIARHVGIDEIRRRKRRHFFKKVTFEKEDLISNEKTPEQLLQMSETNKLLYHAIQSLKPNYRDVVILRSIKDLSVSETAEVLGWNENKVRLNFHRALKALDKHKEALSQ
jgi:RNA polymerase sigma-70 factor, ECF subfamily